MNDQQSQRSTSVPSHVQEAIDELTGLRAQSYRDTSRPQRVIERLTKRLGQPFVVTTIVVLAALWIFTNLAVEATGHRPFDPYPFSALQGLVSFSALVMTVLILTSETRLAEMNERRARLTVQMSMVADQKIAKVIELLEQQRRHDPNQPDAVDERTRAMTEPVSPAAVLQALDEAHQTMISEDR